MKSYEIERLFNKEIVDKKRVGRGIYNRASRRGYTGAVRTQVDYLKGKEKKLYMNNGEVKVSNMYKDINNVPQAKEIMEMEYDKANKLLTEIKKLHTGSALKTYWGFSNSSSVYHLYYKFGVMEKPKTYMDRNRLAKERRAMAKALKIKRKRLRRK